MSNILKPIKKTHGFSLIELIAVIVIMGIIGLGASLFLSYAVKGFVIAHANSEIYQKSNIALERLSREMKHMDEIYQFTNTSILFQRDGDTYGVAKVSDTIQISRNSGIPGPSGGSVLVDNVNTFSIFLEQADGSSWSVPINNDLTGLSNVRISLTINIEGTTRNFTIEMNPVFNNMVNGPTS